MTTILLIALPVVAAVAAACGLVYGFLCGDAHGYAERHEEVVDRRRALRWMEAERIRRGLEQWPGPEEGEC